MFIRDQAGRTARLLLYSGVFWLVVAAATGLMAALSAVGMAYTLVAPDMYDVVRVARLQPVFLNTLVLGWAAMAGTGVGLLIIQRSYGFALHNEPLGQFSVWLWNAVVAAGTGSLLLGFRDGPAFAEFVWPLKLGLFVTLLLLLINVARTLKEVERPLYASVWYTVGGMTWAAVVWFLGNGLWSPQGLGIDGLGALLYGFYTEGLIWLWVVPLAAGAALFAAPVIAEKPLYSRKLAHYGLWLLAMHAGAGAYRLWGADAPASVQAAGAGLGAVSIVAAVAIVVNVLSTVSKSRVSVGSTAAGRSLVVGTVFLLLAAVQATLQSLGIVQEWIYTTQLVFAQHFTALFGGVNLLLFAAIYPLLPMLRQPKDRPAAGKEHALYSERLARWHVALSAIGGGLFVVSLWVGGAMQVNARLLSGAFADTVTLLHPTLLIQAGGLALLLVGQLLLAYTLWRAASARQPVKLPVVLTNPGADSPPSN